VRRGHKERGHLRFGGIYLIAKLQISETNLITTDKGFCGLV
jgi:hypothetical protein